MRGILLVNFLCTDSMTRMSFIRLGDQTGLTWNPARSRETRPDRSKMWPDPPPHFTLCPVCTVCNWQTREFTMGARLMSVFCRWRHLAVHSKSWKRVYDYKPTLLYKENKKSQLLYLDGLIALIVGRRLTIRRRDGYKNIELFKLLLTYAVRPKLHRVSKNVPPLACYSFDKCERILIFLAEV